MFEIKKYDYLDTPKGYQGVVDPKGNFYALNTNDNLNTNHETIIKSFAFRYLQKDLTRYPFLLHDERREWYFSSNHQTFFYREILVDFLGFCSYDGLFGKRAVITFPRSDIANRQITKEQIDTLITLVEKNHNDLRSLESLFQSLDHAPQELIYESEVERPKSKVRRFL